MPNILQRFYPSLLWSAYDGFTEISPINDDLLIFTDSPLPILFRRMGKLKNDLEYLVKSFIRAAITVVSLGRYENKS